MSQHKQGMERVMQSSFKHRRAGTEIATAVIGIEAMLASGIDTIAAVENTDKKVQGRCRSGLAHKAFGKQLADAVTTLDKIITDEGLTIVAQDKPLTGQHKAGLRAVVIKDITRKIIGKEIADIADKAEKVVDELLIIYGVGGAKANAATAANLLTIKTVMQA